MAAAEVATEIDWTTCELVERIPGKVSGQPVVKGTRILPDTIAHNFELGDSIEEILAGFPALSAPQVKGLIRFAQEQTRQQSS